MDAAIAHSIKNIGHIKKTKKLVKCLVRVCEAGYIDLLKDTFNLNTSNRKTCEKALLHACKLGNVDIINLIFGACEQKLGKYMNSAWYLSLSAACEDGQLEILKMYVHKLNNSYSFVFWSDCLEYACRSDNIKLVDFILCSKYADKEFSKHVATYGDQIIIDTLSNGLKFACKSGNTKMVEYMYKLYEHEVLKKGTKYIYLGSELRAASYGGHLKIIEFLVEMLKKYGKFDSDIYNTCFVEACAGGQLAIVEHMLSKHKVSLKCGLHNACEKGHVKIVKYLVSKGATNSNTAMSQAIMGGSVDIIKFLIDTSKNTGHVIKWNDHLCSVCDEGSLKLVKIMIENGATNYNEAMRYACGDFKASETCAGDDCFRSRNRSKIIELLIKKGATNFNECLMVACYDSEYSSNINLKAAELMIKHGATNLNEALNESCPEGCSNPNICKLLINSGADVLDCLENILDFTLYCIYCKYVGIKPDMDHYNECLKYHTPYMLLIASRASANKRGINRLPTELFRTLFLYI